MCHRTCACRGVHGPDWPGAPGGAGQASVPVVPIGRQSGTSCAAQTQDTGPGLARRRVPSPARVVLE